MKRNIGNSSMESIEKGGSNATTRVHPVEITSSASGQKKQESTHVKATNRSIKNKKTVSSNSRSDHLSGSGEFGSNNLIPENDKPKTRTRALRKQSAEHASMNDISLWRAIEEQGERIAAIEEKTHSIHRNILELLANKSLVKATRGWFYDARYTANIENLHHPEFWDKYVKRWVGPNPWVEFNSVFEQFRTYRIEIKVFDFITNEAENSFKLEVGGIQIPWHSKDDSIYVSEYTSKNTESATLRFSVPQAKKPSELIPGATDNRMIAFSFGFISVKRVEE
jgi:hypothetical protein